MRSSRITTGLFINRTAHVAFAIFIAALARADDRDDLVKYSFSRAFNTSADLNQIRESHLVATDDLGHIESHPVHLSKKNGTVTVEADFVSKRGLLNGVAWLISESGEQWNVAGTLDVEKKAAPAETPLTQLPVETATPAPPVNPAESTECSALSYDAFILAQDVESIRASLSALAVEDPLQAALQAREAELSELLRRIAENEGPASVSGAEKSAPTPLTQASSSAAPGSEAPLGSQKKELEKLKQDREALEDELAAWGVM